MIRCLRGTSALVHDWSFLGLMNLADRRRALSYAG